MLAGAGDGDTCLILDAKFSEIEIEARDRTMHRADRGPASQRCALASVLPKGASVHPQKQQSVPGLVAAV
eukprot:COSAG02_NODE_4530_length_5252_cov_5.919658_3_plen_70_part_00